MLIIQGKGASPGVEWGSLHFHIRSGSVVERRKIENVQTEWTRFLQAQQAAVEQLGRLGQKAQTDLGPESAVLFETHQLMAQDDDYVGTIYNGIEGGLNAEAALYDATRQFVQQFADNKSDYMKERAADIRDVSRQIYRILAGAQGESLALAEPAILVVDDLAPSEMLQLDRDMVLGILMLDGSPESHSAIMARSMGIPLVVCCGPLSAAQLSGHEAILDGETGRVLVDPDAQAHAALLEKRERSHRNRKLLERLKGKQNITQDGRKVAVTCDVGLMAEAEEVKPSDGDGVGIFRSEFLYLAAADWPDEDTQFATYRTVLGALRKQTVTMRTMDIGADRDVPYYTPQAQRNPALGMRSLRISLSRPDVFRTQLRALYRASVYGRLRILLPMVASVWEVREARLACKEVMAELEKEGCPYDANVPLGILIETPSAVLISDRLAREADFFSIGTIDLTQYLTACDRQSGQMGRFFDPHHPALLRAIRMVVQNGHRQGIPVTVCGDLACDLTMTETFLALGVDEITVHPADVLPLREKIRSTNVAAVRQKILDDLDSDVE